MTTRASIGAHKPTPESRVLTAVPGGRKANMLTWQDAHRIANVAAAQAHAALGVDLTRTRVDVVEAIATAQVELMWQPMPTMFGCYVNETGSRPGILVNAGLPAGARRHTAAHELGHHRLHHTTTVDDGSTIDTVAAEEYDAVPQASRPRSWPDQEKTAEAFAAWFLMPRRVVATALAQLGLHRPRSALDAYRLCLLLGTSYRTTLRHLPNLRLAHPQNCAAWARVAPGRLKSTLDRGAAEPPSRRTDVWLLEPGLAGTTLHLHPGDRLVLPGITRQADVHHPDTLVCVGTAASSERAAGLVFEVDDVVGPRDDTLTVSRSQSASWSFPLAIEPAPRGIDPRSIV